MFAKSHDERDYMVIWHETYLVLVLFPLHLKNKPKFTHNKYTIINSGFLIPPTDIE